MPPWAQGKALPRSAPKIPTVSGRCILDKSLVSAERAPRPHVHDPWAVIRGPRFLGRGTRPTGRGRAPEPRATVSVLTGLNARRFVGIFVG